MRTISRRRFLQAGLIAGGPAAGGPAAAGGTAARARPAGRRGPRAGLTRTWLLPRATFASLSNICLGGRPAVCANAFGQGTTWFSVNYGGPALPLASPIPAGYPGVGVLTFQAYQDDSAGLGLVNAVQAGLPQWVQAVQYDAENWDATPMVEQGAWFSYAQRFCQLAHSLNLKVVLSPANDLCNNVSNCAYGGHAQYPLRTGEANYQAYVRYRFAAAAQWLLPGDIYEYQAQALETLGSVGGTSVYETISAQVARQIPAGSGVIYLTGIGTTAPGWDGATCAQLTTAARSVAGLAAGFWPNLNATQTQIRPMICMLAGLGY